MIDELASLRLLSERHRSDPEGSIKIESDGTIKIGLNTIHFVCKRTKEVPELNDLLIDLWSNNKDRYKDYEDLMWGWLYDLPDVIKAKKPLAIYKNLIAEFDKHGEPRGAADNGDAFIASASQDENNLLDRDLLHLEFKVGNDWYSLVSVQADDGTYTFPAAVAIKDETRLFENENALVRPDHLPMPRYELHQGKWFIVGRRETDLPLDQYPISTNPDDRGRKRIYWDGNQAFCPLTGFELNVTSYDRSMKNGGVT